MDTSWYHKARYHKESATDNKGFTGTSQQGSTAGCITMTSHRKDFMEERLQIPHRLGSAHGIAAMVAVMLPPPRCRLWYLHDDTAALPQNLTGGTSQKRLHTKRNSQRKDFMKEGLHSSEFRIGTSQQRFHPGRIRRQRLWYRRHGTATAPQDFTAKASEQGLHTDKTAGVITNTS